jgi:hypothetical protein
MTVLIEVLVVAAAIRLNVTAADVRAELDPIMRAHPGNEPESCVQYLCGRISWLREPGA